MRALLEQVAQALAVASVTVLVGACDSLLETGQDTPSEARVVVAGTSTEQLRLVTSNDFFRQATGSSTESAAVLVTADTTLFSPEFDQQYDLGPLTRFFVRLDNPEGAEAQVTLRVFFDEELAFEQSSTLEGVEVEFNFVFQR